MIDKSAIEKEFCADEEYLEFLARWEAMSTDNKRRFIDMLLTSVTPDELRQAASRRH